ncbi:hypothetical protein [Exiguobacterium artemiae]|uniref:hypothetical protein n=1 Tax=Exiguobacterium artemiae TaxID=340145 RepID=UPI00296560DF|nr:hypothetical protein [Exiguobacterium sibiricum]MDW2886580.1 hypothetical protein [Exiguobacterium sibiricum]
MIRQLVRGRIVFKQKGRSNYLLFAGYLLLVFYATALFLENLHRGENVSLKGIALIILALIFLLTISPLIVEDESSNEKNQIDPNRDKKTFWTFLKNRFCFFIDQVLFFVLMPFIFSTGVLTSAIPFLQWNELWLTGGLVGWVFFLSLSSHTTLFERCYYRTDFKNQYSSEIRNRQLAQKKACFHIILLVGSVWNFSLAIEGLADMSKWIGGLIAFYYMPGWFFEFVDTAYLQYKNDSTSL